MTKLQKLGYKHKVALIFGRRSNDTIEGIWRAHFNKTWEQMIRDTLNLSLEEFIENTDLDSDTTLQKKDLPKVWVFL